MPTPPPILGIDLGTTNSLVAVAGWPKATDGPRIIPDDAGRTLLPSVVRYNPDGTLTIGHPARQHAPANSTTISSVKRLMGRALKDAAADQPFLPFRLIEGPNQTIRIAVGGKQVSPQEVSAHILRHLKQQAERALNTTVTKAVITVPAYFDDAQRQATRDAGRLAGLEVVRIVAEPTAAALAYGLGTRHSQPTTVAIYDLGGGTFDVSILRITPSGDSGLGADAFQVLATAGDTHLGGDDFDQAIVTWIAAQLLAANPKLPAPDDAMRAALKAAAEKAKIELSTADSALINLSSSFTLTRTTLHTLIAPLIDRTITACQAALRDAKRQMGNDQLSAVILVGGATRTPLVREKVAAFFGLTPYTAIDPDQAIALGAAVQASILMGSNTSALLLDVIPLSLGIETANGAFAKIIMRNAPIPAAAHEMFSTQIDGQTSIKVHILQGEREMAADCRSLGEFHLRGIPPMPAGIPQLRVEFRVDASGVLSVTAAELRSGKRLDVQIVPHHGLTRDEVDRIERESFQHAKADMTAHRLADLLANSRLDIHWIEKQLVAHGKKLTPNQLTAITTALATLQRHIASPSDPDAFHTAKETLAHASIPLHEIAISESLKDG